MIWLTSLSVLLVIITQQNGADSAAVPWTDPATANSFMTCLVQNIAASPAFQQQEKTGLESIVQTMMPAMSSLNRGSSRAQISAMNMAFASSLAEFVVAEENANTQLINGKKQALNKVLNSCFMSTMGSVNKRFINEMNDLVTMLTQEAIAESNEVDTSNQFTAAGGSTFTGSFGTSTAGTNVASSANSATQQSSTSSATSFGASNFAFGSSASSSQSMATALAASLSSSGAFKSVFGAGLSPQILSQISVSATQSSLASIGVPASQVNSLSYAVQNSVSSLGYGASVQSYASAMANALASGLMSAGILNSGNVNSVGSSLGTAYAQALTSLAPQYNIQIQQSSAAGTSAATGATMSTSTATGATAASSATQQSSTSAATSFGASQSSANGASGVSSSSLGLLLSSSQGLTSPAATSRVQGLAQGLLQAFGPNGFQSSAFSQGLGSAYSSLLKSGMTSQTAQVEALMEMTAALVQILSSAQVGTVNLSSVSSTAQAVSSGVTAAFG